MEKEKAMKYNLDVGAGMIGALIPTCKYGKNPSFRLNYAHSMT